MSDSICPELEESKRTAISWLFATDFVISAKDEMFLFTSAASFSRPSVVSLCRPMALVNCLRVLSRAPLKSSTLDISALCLSRSAANCSVLLDAREPA